MTARKKRTKASKTAKASKKGKTKKKPLSPPVAPIVAAGSPEKYRARVRMYRHGLGDCFLLSFTRKQNDPFHILIDCGALGRDKTFMTSIVEHIRDTVRAGSTTGKARLDAVVATHEHKD